MAERRERREAAHAPGLLELVVHLDHRRVQRAAREGEEDDRVGERDDEDAPVERDRAAHEERHVGETDGDEDARHGVRREREDVEDPSQP